MTREELIEYLAALEHERWSNWQAYVHNLCIKNEDGSLTIPKKYVYHWNWEIALKYKDLPDNIKESDRKEVYKIMFLFDHMFNENKTLQKTLQNSEKNAENLQRELDIKNEALKLIKDIAYDYDGFNDIDSLKGLIDDLRAIAIRGLKGQIILERTDEDER